MFGGLLPPNGARPRRCSELQARSLRRQNVRSRSGVPSKEVVSFHFGLPDRNLVARVRRTGAKIISSATSVDEARWLEDQGCDAIIAQGYEPVRIGERFSHRMFLPRSAQRLWCHRWSTP
jgi:hypothetical protein